MLRGIIPAEFFMSENRHYKYLSEKLKAICQNPHISSIHLLNSVI